MTQEEKELLLEDICTRLPYGVILFDNLYNRVLYGVDWFNPINGILTTGDKSTQIEEIKPYLRSMSSMTEEEHNIVHDLLDCFNPKNELWMLTDFLSKRMLDYRGLIEKGLALEAPEGLYNFDGIIANN